MARAKKGATQELFTEELERMLKGGKGVLGIYDEIKELKNFHQYQVRL